MPKNEEDDHGLKTHTGKTFKVMVPEAMGEEVGQDGCDGTQDCRTPGWKRNLQMCVQGQGAKAQETHPPPSSSMPGEQPLGTA